MLALKNMIKILNQGKEEPLFMIKTKNGKRIDRKHFKVLKQDLFLKMVVIALGLDSRHYTFHAFRHSGASLAF